MKMTCTCIEDCTRLKCKCETIRCLEDHTGVQLQDLRLEKQAKTNKENDELSYIKIKNFFSLKNPKESYKDKPHAGMKYLSI